MSLIDKLKLVPLAAAANARWKSWMVERDAASIRRQYSDGAEGRGPRPPAGTQLRRALQERIGVRIRNLGWPKPPGELHIFLAYPLCNWEAVLREALAPFGRVSEFEWRSRGFDDAAADWIDHRDAMNADMLRAFHAANLLRPVDVVVGYVSGYTVAPECLLEMAAAGAVITNFCFDDKIRWPGELRGGRYTSPAAIAHAVDLNLTSDPDGVRRYFAHGGLGMFHAEAADPQWYRPLELPFEFDVSFVGARYGWRPVLIEELKRRGIEVACFGKGWPNGAIANSQMNELYAKSRINLGCGGIGYSKNLLCLKGRDFEVPMSGAVYLTQDNPELSLVFDVGREIATYRDVDQCAEVIRRILAHPADADRMRRAARTRSLRDHTYTARWSTVLQMLGAVENQPRP